MGTEEDEGEWGKGAFAWEGQGSFDSLEGSFARMLPSKKLRAAASLVQIHVEDADGRLKPCQKDIRIARVSQL